MRDDARLPLRLLTIGILLTIIFVTLFVAFAIASEASGQGSGWLATALLEIGLAVVVGTAAGVAGGWLLVQAAQRDWAPEGIIQVGVLGLSLAAYYRRPLCRGLLDDPVERRGTWLTGGAAVGLVRETVGQSGRLTCRAGRHD